METTDYSGMFIYKDYHLDHILTSEGRLKWDIEDEMFYAEYFIKDHLGNVRSVITTKPESHLTVQGTDYYPFGLEIPVYGDHDNQIKYNSKELQNEADLTWYDYGARFYDPVIGRWHVVDPMAEKYYGWSPYVYGLNNPIRFVDPDGMEVWIPEVDNNGNVSYIAEMGDNMETFREQFNVSDEQAQAIFKKNNKMTTGEQASSNYNETNSLSFSTPVEAGDAISGQSVKEVTGSNVLKLDCSGKMYTGQRAINQAIFAARNESFNGDETVNFANYFKDAASQSNGWNGLTAVGFLNVHGENVPVTMNLKAEWNRTATSRPNGQNSSEGFSRFFYYHESSFGQPVLMLKVSDEDYSKTINYLYEP